MRFFIFGLILLVLSACLSEPNCLVTTSNEVKIAFKQANTNTPKKVIFEAITSSGTDVVYKTDSITQITLYVDPRATQTTFKFYDQAAHLDSLTLSYKIQNIVISPACGAFPFYSNLKVVAYTFSDTVLVTNSLLSNVTSNLNVEVKY